MTEDNSNNAAIPEAAEWAEHVRTFLEHGEENAILFARDTANDTSIRQFLTQFIEAESTDMRPEEGFSLAEQLDLQGKCTEAALLRLLVLSVIADVAEAPEIFPAGEREELIETSFATCQECTDIASGVGIPAIAARYMFTLGRGLGKLRKWALARSTCEEALHIYQELAEKEPVAYKPCVAAVLVFLGDVMCEQRAFSYAQLAYEEARDIYRELAEKEPDTYKQYVALTLNSLDTVVDRQRGHWKAPGRLFGSDCAPLK